MEGKRVQVNLDRFSVVSDSVLFHKFYILVHTRGVWQKVLNITLYLSYLPFNVYFCRIFEDVVKYCKEYSNLIPLSFVLGFYVSVVMTRWWSQYISIPFPDTLAVYVSATIHGHVSLIFVQLFVVTVDALREINSWFVQCSRISLL